MSVAAPGPGSDMSPWLTLLDLAPVRVWLLDAEHRARWANRAACAVFGLPLEALVGHDPAKVFGGARAEDDMPARLSALAGTIAHWSGWAIYPDGTHRYTERTYLPFSGENPHGPCYFEFTVDGTELMRERERAGQAERRLVEAIRSLPDGFAIEDASGRLVLCNEPYARVYGRTAETMTGLSFDTRAEMLAPRLISVGNAGELPDPASAVERLRRVRKTEEPVHIRAVDGCEFLVRRATTSDGGRIVLHSDLTALRDPWDILSDVFETCPTPIFVADAQDLRVRMSNAAAREMIVAGSGDIEFGYGLEWVSAAERDGFVATLRAEGRVEGFEARFRRRDGVELWLSIWARVATIRGEAVVIATATNVTEQRRATDALQDAWDRVSSVIEACPTPITMARVEDGGIVYLNRAAKELMRLDEAVDRSTVPHWRSTEDRDLYIAALRRHGRVDGWEHTFRRGDGSEVHLAMWSRTAEFRGTDVIVTTSMDLTEARAEEAERARQRRQLEEAEKLAALGEILSGIAHELNNPLSVLAGQAVLLEETAPDEATRRRALQIAEQAARCARTVRSFLDLAHERPRREDVIDLAAVIEEALEVTRPEWSGAGIAIDWVRPTGCFVAGDADRLRQVFVNLVVNAVQAMADEGGRGVVEIRCSSDPERRLIAARVRDTGPGVPEALRDKIFQPFFSTKGSGGAGIGLALCRRIVTTHGGRIRLEAGERGATFLIELPLARAPAGPAQDGDPAAGLRVLVVVGDPSEPEALVDALRRHGIAGAVERSALDAIDRLAADMQWDAILLADNLPDMAADRLASAISRRWPELGDAVAVLPEAVGREDAGSTGTLAGRGPATPLAPDEIDALVRRIARARSISTRSD